MIPEPSDANLIVQADENGTRIRIMKDAKNEKELYIEIWNSKGYQKSAKLPDLSMVYNDPVFGGISFDKNQMKIVFISEQPEKKFNLLWGNEEAKAENASVIDKYNYDASFGETLDKKKQPVITVFNLETLSLTRTQVPLKDAYPASPIFDESGEGIIFHAYHLPTAKLGLNYCHN